MPGQLWTQLIAGLQQAAGALFNTYTTAKSVLNPQSLVDLWRNFWAVGTKVRITVHMSVSNIVTTPGTITFQVMMGTIVVWTSGAIQLNAAAHTLLPAKLVIDLVCQVVGTGTTAKLMGQGVLTGVMFTKTAGQVDGVNSETVINVPVTAPAQGGGFDSTIANLLDFWVGFSINNAGNGVRVEQYEVESLNYNS